MTEATSSSTCTAESDPSAVQPDQGLTTGNTAPSVITIWPTSSIDTTCTTFSTVVRPSSKSGSHGTNQFTVLTVTLLSGSSTVLTIPLSSTGSSSTCTETSTFTVSTIRTSTIQTSTEDASLAGQSIPAIPQPTTSETASAAASSESVPPPQTEFFQQQTTFDAQVYATTDLVYNFGTSVPAAYGDKSPSGYESTSDLGELMGASETSTVAVPVLTFPTQGTSSTSATNTTLVEPTSFASSTSVGNTSSTTLNATSLVTPPPSSTSAAIPTSATVNGTSTIADSSLPVESCGAVEDRGANQISFDDLILSNGSEFYKSLPTSYHRLHFSDGFRLVDSTLSHYVPSSGKQMLEYSTSAGPVAQIGLNDLSNECFRFNFLGLSLGCNSTGASCDFTIAGLQWNGTHDVVEANKTVQVEPCTGPADCTLLHQLLDSAAASQFTNLTALNISLTVDGKPQTWWADDLSIAWTDDSCKAASCRALVPEIFAKRRAPVQRTM
ncbi:hypothetical protein V8F20_004223, partial [Naviculisporaceae sp. PSN 640]